MNDTTASTPAPDNVSPAPVLFTAPPATLPAAYARTHRQVKANGRVCIHRRPSARHPGRQQAHHTPHSPTVGTAARSVRGRAMLRTATIS